VPDDHDYADLAALLAHPEQWTSVEADRARLLRDHQARTVAAYDQRDTRRVTAMRAVVAQLDDALARWAAR
jgi:hypothetical protein